MPSFVIDTIKIDKMDNSHVETHGQFDVETHGQFDVETHGQFDVETHGRASLHSMGKSKSINPSFYREPKSISTFIGGFKSAVNSEIDNYIDKNNLNILKYNKNNHFFQPNYYDHIIRNERSYQAISKYILNNPAKWCWDRFNPEIIG